MWKVSDNEAVIINIIVRSSALEHLTVPSDMTPTASNEAFVCFLGSLNCRRNSFPSGDRRHGHLGGGEEEVNGAIA